MDTFRSNTRQIIHTKRLRNFRKGERWAWWALWLLPLLWLSYFLVNPDTVHNLVIAIITTLGLVLPYRRFFSASAEQPSHVR